MADLDDGTDGAFFAGADAGLLLALAATGFVAAFGVGLPAGFAVAAGFAAAFGFAAAVRAVAGVTGFRDF